MKQFKDIMIIIAILMAIIIGCGIYTVATRDTPAQEHEATADSIYTEDAVITEIYTEEDLVICVDSMGNEWGFYGAEGWQVGEHAMLTMDACGTASVLDDVVASAQHTH